MIHPSTAQFFAKRAEEYRQAGDRRMEDAMTASLSASLEGDYYGGQLEREFQRDLKKHRERLREDNPTEPSREQQQRYRELTVTNPGADVFMDPLFGGDVSLEVWAFTEEGRRRVYEEVIDRRGETLT